MTDKNRYEGPWEDDGQTDVVPGTEARPYAAEPIGAVINRLVSRRSLLKGSAATGAAMVLMPSAMLKSGDAAAETGWLGSDGSWHSSSDRLTFDAIAPSWAEDIVVPDNYTVDVVLRWGDPLTSAAPEFDVNNQTAAAQSQQFGYNADLVLWYPLPHYVKRSVTNNEGILGPRVSWSLGLIYPQRKNQTSRRALMVVNHEYTSANDMFPDYDSETYPTQEQTLVEIEAHGFSIVEVVLSHRGKWEFDRSSIFNRRSTGTTAMDITGPLKGHSLMQTTADPEGVEVLGSFNNCSGGKTPWGTILTCEENFDQYFANFDSASEDVQALSQRIPANSGSSERGWEQHVDRFDLSADSNEYNRFGFVIEIDPYDPSSRPMKRTALGRFKHEAASCSVAGNGQVAVYTGDDSRFEYVYKFITDGTYSRQNRESNKTLLESGTLYVARFDVGAVEGDDRGTGVWLELSPNNPALADWTLAEILLNTRGAADVVGATPMDRPEDIEVNQQNGWVYIALTNNSQREEPNEANPRIENQHGHVIELVEDVDAVSMTFSWNILVRCGDPSIPEHETRFGDITDPVAAGVSPISDPDNLVHDDDGNLWIATDGMPGSGDYGFGQNDGVFAVELEGENRGYLKQFLSGIPGGEVCGPEFAGDNRTFFCAIQHPNDGKAFENIWPLDEVGRDNVSKPSLLAVREKTGRKIGQ